MAERPDLTVRMFLNVKRPYGNTSTDSELIASFAQRFRAEHWPPDRPLPQIYYDPRSLAMDAKQRRSFTPSALWSTGKTSFVSSANFTEAAHERNVEVGVLARSGIIAERLVSFFS